MTAANSLRLLFVSHTFPPSGRPLANVGGMQRVATELHAALSAHPDLILHSSLLRSTWRWIYLRTPGHLLTTAQLVDDLVRRGELDAVLFSSVVGAALVLPLTRGLRRSAVKKVAIAHGDDVVSPFPGYASLVRRALAGLDGVAAVSRATGAACRERGLDPQRLHLIPNGIDLRCSAPPPERNATRAGLATALGQPPLPAEAYLLCSVGRQVERKGFAWFVREVMPLLPPEVHYWVAGEGPHRRALLAAIRDQRLEHRVRWLGGVREHGLLKLYQAADLLVMPNIHVAGTMEGFGVVLLEAGSCGLPAIAADLEGICDVVRTSENGLLVPSGNPATFAQAIARCHNNPWLQASLAAGALRRVRQYAWPLVAQQHVDLLRQLAGPAVRSHASMARRSQVSPCR
ncbi:MAG: glycosyltransferase family 4 protein [Candidatus Latescibacteria bacterium]|nr:glycosyltransferase family 4 protein [Candidatus Latescibacterota bacterium]